MTRAGSQLTSLLVVIVNWNCGSDTTRAIQSVEGQNADVLVVDNGSTDGSGEAVVDLLDPGRFIRLAENRGFAAGANVGIRWGLDAGFDFICLLNADAVVEAQALRHLQAALAADMHLGAVAAKILEANTKAIQTPGGGTIHWLTGRCVVPPRSGKALEFLGGTCMMLRADALRAVGAFDERFFMYWEDVDLSVRLTRAGWTLGYVPQARALHAGGSALGAPSALARQQYLTSMILFFRKHSALWLAPVSFRLALSLLAALARTQPSSWLVVLRAITAAFRGGGPVGRLGPKAH
jgi:GT2 family glycosyltransferase